MKSLDMIKEQIEGVNEVIEFLKSTGQSDDDSQKLLSKLEQIKQDLEVLDLIYTKHIDISDLKLAVALEKDRNYTEEEGLRIYNIAPFRYAWTITIDEYKKLKKWLEEQE